MENAHRSWRGVYKIQTPSSRHSAFYNLAITWITRRAYRLSRDIQIMGWKSRLHAISLLLMWGHTLQQNASYCMRLSRNLVTEGRFYITRSEWIRLWNRFFVKLHWHRLPAIFCAWGNSSYWRLPDIQRTVFPCIWLRSKGKKTLYWSLDKRRIAPF